MSPVKEIFTYRIDQDDKLISVSENWNKFAEDNEANPESCESPFILNKPLWSFIEDKETIYLYQELIKKVRAEKDTLKVSIRCDSPTLRRLIEIYLKPLTENHIEFSSKIIRIEEREPIQILDSSKERSNEFLRVCSYCKQVAISDTEWVEIELVVQNLHLFEEDKLPQITHGVCPTCYKKIMAELKSL